MSLLGTMGIKDWSLGTMVIGNQVMGRGKGGVVGNNGGKGLDFGRKIVING